MKYLPFLILFFVILGCGSSPKPAISNEPPIALKADELIRSYKENELAADDRFKGKRLEVSGKVTEISETFGTLQADLGNMNELVTVKCLFTPEQRTSLSKIKQGSAVTFLGTGDGMTGGLYVGMTDCSIK